MKRSVLVAVIIAIVAIALTLVTTQQDKRVEAETEQDPIVVYQKLLAATEDGEQFLYEDNIKGRIVWNEQYFMESLINMYEVTGEERYLDIFVKQADHVLAVRDDKSGREDFAGRSRPGWQTGGYYTLGVPIIIHDGGGNPSLEVQGVHMAGNNHTAVQIVAGKDGHFTLIITNNFRRKIPERVIFKGLTMADIEEKINANLSPFDYVRVRDVGDNPPAPGNYTLSETYRMVMHELHTPLIGVPFLRFASLVFENDELAHYRPNAEEYVSVFEESYRNYEDSWREDEEGGYFLFEPNGKYWASGLPLPYNGLSANGRFLLWLYRVTGNVEYLEKASKLAQKVKAGIQSLPDGTMTMPYWYGLPYQGWQNHIDEPINGLYIENKPIQGTEDISHFSLTLRFMNDAYQMGVVFERSDLEAVTKTFLENIWKPGGELTKGNNWREGAFLAHSLDGKGRAYDYAAGAFSLLTPWNKSVLPLALEVYKGRYINPEKIDFDYEYGYVLLGWSELAYQDKGRVKEEKK